MARGGGPIHPVLLYKGCSARECHTPRALLIQHAATGRLLPFAALLQFDVAPAPLRRGPTPFLG